MKESPQFDLFEKKLSGYGWRQLLRHVLCPAYVHVQAFGPTDYGAMFFHNGTPEQISQFRSSCEIPPLICADIESGEDFPSMFGCGMVNRPDLAYIMGHGTALNSLKKGFNWTLAPVVDIALDIESPMVGLRAAGENADQVIPTTVAYLRGLQDHGMVATAKHFPGDGFSSLDQHITTPVNTMTELEWRSSYGRTFGAAISAGVGCVMPGHIGLAWAEKPDPRSGLNRPATVSRRLLHDLLREEMGFSGVIVSDAMGMGGVAGFMNIYDAYAAFLEAGGDCLLFARYDIFLEKQMERCLLEGKLSEETLFARALNLLKLKQRFGLLESGSREVSTMAAETWEDARRTMVEGAVRIVKDLDRQLPIKPRPNLRVLHVSVCNNPDDATDKLKEFSSYLEPESQGEVTFWSDPGPEKLFFTLREPSYDLVVVSLWNVPDYGTGILRLYGAVARNMMDGWMHLGIPTIFVQHGYPFHYRHYLGAMRTVVSTHGFTSDSSLVAAKRIFGAHTRPF